MIPVTELEQILPAERLRAGEPLAGHCSFKTGGPADCFLEAADAGELKAVLHCLSAAGCPYFLIGRGTNLIVGDRGYRGAVISLAGDFLDLGVREDRIAAGAGVTLTALSRAALNAGLAGLEFASGIPGSLGGALVMNAGAYGGEMSQVVESVTVLDPSDLSVREISGDGMSFGYRTSRIRSTGEIVLGAVIRLKPGRKEEIEALMRDLAERRREKQPLSFPSAGSTFKRPEGHFAGKLIEDAGLKGFRVGDAQVSEKHCGFVINRGNATSGEIMQLIGEVQKRVYERSGIMLEREVICLGEF